jgi:hypothetical protein
MEWKLVKSIHRTTSLRRAELMGHNLIKQVEVGGRNDVDCSRGTDRFE